MDGPSSSEVIKKAIEPLWLGCLVTKRSEATTIAARAVFMSAEPRPYNLPSRMLGKNGSEFHASNCPVGTTSVCPAKQNTGLSVPRRAHKLSTSSKRMFSILKPTLANRSAMMFWQS